MQGALLAAILLFAATAAAAADAAVSMALPAGEVKSIRLRNLPLGAMVAVRVISSGKLLVAMVSEKRKALFRGSLERRLTFTVQIPESGDYYLVLNNRTGTEALEVQADIRAAPARRKPPPADDKGEKGVRATFLKSEIRNPASSALPDSRKLL